MDGSYFLVAASAVSLYGALAYPHCFWLSFIFLVPLFYTAFANQINFKHGLLWGIIFWALVLQPIFTMLVEKVYLTTSVAFFATGVLVAYMSFYAGFWFYFAGRPLRCAYQIFLSWFLVTFGYFFFIDQMSLWIFEVIEGYQLVHPLLPLANCPKLVWALPFLGKHFLLLSLIVLQLSLVFAYGRRKAFFGLSAVALIPFFIGFLIPQQKLMPPVWLDQVVCARIDPFLSSGAWERAHAVREKLMQARKHDPALIIMPESALSFSLNEFKDVINYFNEYALSPGIELIIGGHRKESEKVYNSAYHLKGGQIINSYDKSHGIFFVERLPTWTPIFFSKISQGVFNEPFEQATVSSCVFNTQLFSMRPVLCSELFFGSNLCDDTRGEVLLVLVNDAWFSSVMQCELMKLYALFYATMCQKNLLYISYSFSVFIDLRGHVYDLRVV